MNDMLKRILSFALALVMVFGMMPVEALATELGNEEPVVTPTEEHTHTHESAVTTAATCEEEGVMTYTCSCGDTYTEAIAALGHSYVEGVCACGATEHTHAHESAVASEATCEAEGVMTYTCSCGDTYTEAIAALGHSYVEGVCACGATEPTEAPAEEETEAPVEEEPEASKEELSGETRKIYYYNVESWDEVWAAWSFDEEDFDDVAHPGKEMDDETALENVYVIRVPVEADEVLFSDGIEVTEELLEQERLDGVTVTHEVAVRLEDDEFYDLYQDEEWANYAKVVKALEETEAPTESHSCSYEGAVTKAATCEEAGEMTYACTCGDSYTEVIAAIGHNYKDSQTAPTCEAAGEITYTCVNCGDSNTEVMPALGHKYEDGKCTACGATDPVVAALVAKIEQMVADLPTEITSEQQAEDTAAALAEIDETVESDAYPADAYQNLDWAKIMAAYEALDAYTAAQNEEPYVPGQNAPVVLGTTTAFENLASAPTTGWNTLANATLDVHKEISVSALDSYFRELAVEKNPVALDLKIFTVKYNDLRKYVDITSALSFCLYDSNGQVVTDKVTSSGVYTLEGGVSYKSQNYTFSVGNLTIKIFDVLEVKTTVPNEADTYKYGKVYRGNSVTVDVAEKSGYGISVTGAATGNAAGQYTVGNIMEDKTLIVAYTLATDSTVQINGEHMTATGGGAVVENGSANIAVTPVAGYYITGVTLDDEPITGTYEAGGVFKYTLTVGATANTYIIDVTTAPVLTVSGGDIGYNTYMTASEIVESIFARVNTEASAPEVDAAHIEVQFEFDDTFGSTWLDLDSSNVSKFGTNYDGAVNTVRVKVRYIGGENNQYPATGFDDYDVITVNLVENRPVAPVYTAEVESKVGTDGIKAAAAAAAAELGLAAEDFTVPSGWQTLMSTLATGATETFAVTAVYDGGAVYKPGTVTVNVTVTKSLMLPAKVSVTDSEDGGDVVITNNNGTVIGSDAYTAENPLTVTVTPKTGAGYGYYVESITVNGVPKTVSYNGGSATASFEVENSETENKSYEVKVAYSQVILTAKNTSFTVNGYTGQNGFDYAARLAAYQSALTVENCTESKPEFGAVTVQMYTRTGWKNVSDLNATTHGVYLDVPAQKDIRLVWSDNSGKYPTVTSANVTAMVTDSRVSPSITLGEMSATSFDTLDEAKAAFEAAILVNGEKNNSATLSVEYVAEAFPGTLKANVKVSNNGPTWIASTTAAELTATVDINKYDVIWNPNGGEWGENDSENKTDPIAYGGTPTAPADPTKEGETFLGWTVGENSYTKVNGEYSLPAVTGDITYTASWAGDKNGNGVDDKDETATITVVKSGNGSVSLCAPEGNKTTITGSTEGTYTVIFDSSDTDDGAKILVTSEPTDTVNTDGHVDYVVKAPEFVTVANNANKLVEVEFDSVDLGLTENAYTAKTNLHSSKLTALLGDIAQMKTIVLDGLFGEGNYDPDAYTVAMQVTEYYIDVTTSNDIEKGLIIADLRNATEISDNFKIILNATATTPEVSKVVRVKVSDSRPQAEITAPETLTVEFDRVSEVRAAVEKAVSSDYGIPVVATKDIILENKDGEPQTITFTVNVPETVEYKAATEKKVVVTATGKVHPAKVTLDNDASKGTVEGISTGNYNAKEDNTIEFTVTPKDGNYVASVKVNEVDITKQGEYNATVFSGKITIENGDVDAEKEYVVAVEYGTRDFTVLKTVPEIFFNKAKDYTEQESDIEQAIFAKVVETNYSYDMFDISIYPVPADVGSYTYTITLKADDVHPAVVKTADIKLVENRQELANPITPITIEVSAVEEYSNDALLAAINLSTYLPANAQYSVSYNRATLDDGLKQGDEVIAQVIVTIEESDANLESIWNVDVKVVGKIYDAIVTIAPYENGEVKYERETLTMIPAEGYFVDTLVVNERTSNIDSYETATNTLANGKGCDLGVVPKYDVAVTFSKPSITVEDKATVTYYVGLIDEDAEDFAKQMNDLIFKTLNETETGIVYNPTNMDAAKTEILYRARENGKAPYTLDITTLGLNSLIENVIANALGSNVVTVDVPVQESWQSIGQQWVEYPEPSTAELRAIIEGLMKNSERLNALMNGTDAQRMEILGEVLAENESIALFFANYGAHQFGENENERIKLVNDGVESNYCELTLEDNRALTEIKLNAGIEVTYGSYTETELLSKVLNGVYANGSKIDAAKVSFVTKNVTELNAADAVEVTVAYAGNQYDYKPSTATTTIKVVKAEVTVSVDNRLIKWQDGLTYNLPVVTNPAGVDTINFIAGLNVEGVNVNNGFKGFVAQIQLMLPEELQELLGTADALLQGAGLNVSFANGASMKLSELKGAVDALDNLFAGSEYEEYFRVLLNMLSSLPTETADIEIIIGGSMPTDIGAYVVGAISADANYTTDFGVGAVVIYPDGIKAELAWNMTDDNFVITNTLLATGTFDAGAHAVSVGAGGNLEDATAQVAEIFLGMDIDGTITIEMDQTKIDVGAYVEVAMTADWGNSMYYSVPLVRPIVVVAESLNVDFLDDNGNINNERHYQFLNVPQNGMEGNLKITYKQGDKAGQPFELPHTVKYFYAGVQTNGVPYASETAPTHAGAYTITAVVVARNGDMITHAGQGIGALVIEPSKSTTTVENEAIKWNGAEHKINNFVTTASVNVPGLKPDATIISAGVSADLNADIGLDAIKGNVNVDMPSWMDELLKKLNILEAGYNDGITADVFLSYIEKLEAELVKLGVETDAFTKIVDVVKQLPAKTTLTFHDDKGYSEVGVYLIIGVVTDSDHYPSADAGVMIIYPDATKVELRFNETWDGNNVFSQAYLKNYDLDAQAYALNAPADAQPLDVAPGKVVNLFVGFADHGELEFTSNKLELDNGIYAEVSFIWDLSNSPYYAEPISREVIIVPNNAKIEFVGEDGNVNNERHFQFINQPQGMDTIRVTLVDGTVLNLTAEDDRVAIYYLGVQTNGMPYASYEAPVHAGAYEVTAQYTDRDAQGRVMNLGIGVGAMVIEPSKSETSVDNAAYPYGGKHHAGELVHVASANVPGLTPDSTVISAGLSADLSNITGLNAINGTVNIDLPAWFDEVMDELNVLEAGYADGISADVFLSYVNKIREGLKKLEVDTASFDEIVSFVEQLPINTNLTFEDNIGYTEVGAYLVVAVVTDSDHYPSIGAGVMVIHPNATKVELQFEEDWNDNNVFTWYALQNMNLEAKAYLNGAYCEPADKKVVNLYFGFADNGKFLLDAVTYGQTIKDVPEFRNGAYTQLALVQDLGNDMYYAKPISRNFVIVPTPAMIEFVDDNGNVNADRHFIFNNQPQGMKARVTIAGAEATDLSGLTVTYVGVQTNGEFYNSTTAPTHSGAYTVTAAYTARDEHNRLVTLGAAVGAMVIEPAKSTMDVQSKLHEYDNTPVATNDMVKSGSVVTGLTPDKTIITAAISTDGTFSENALSAVTGAVNVDFPAWVDNILTQYAPSIYNGMKAGEFNVKLMAKLESFVADAEAVADEYDIPADKLIDALNAALAEVEEIVEQLPADVVLTFKDQVDVAPVDVGTYLIVGIATDSDHYPSADVGVLVIYPKVTKAKLDWFYEDSNGIFTLPALKNIDMSAIGIVDGAENENVTAMIDYLTVGIDENGKLIMTNLPNNLTSNGAYTEVAYIPVEIGAEMTVAAPIIRSFVVVPQTVTVEVADTTATYGETYEVPVNVIKKDASAVDSDSLTVTYIGVNAAVGLYNSTVKPTNSGVYTVIATYVEKDGNNEYAYVGMNVGTLTISVASASVDVKNRIYEYSGEKFDVMNLITSDPADAKLAVITAALNLDGDFSKNGILATGSSVNIDFPARADEVIKQIMPEAYTNGIALNPFFQKLDEISADLVEYGFDAAAVETLKNHLEQLPSNTKLTFKEQAEINPSTIGVYLVTAVVMDPDYIPTVDAGLLVITSDVDKTTLKWNYRDSNNIITREVIAEMNMAASAYVDGALDADVTERISYVIMGVGSNGDVTLTNDPAKIKNLPNGVYTEVAYIYQQIDAEMVVAIPILRNFAIVNHNVDVDFEDINVAYNGERHPVEVTLNGNPVEKPENLTVTYINLGRGYYSTVAPTKIGSYTVVAKYEEIINGDTAAFGMEVGNVTITPATSKISVTGDTVTYDGNPHNATVTVEGGNGKADYILISGGATVKKDLADVDVDVDAFYGNVNIDFPAWLDSALAEYEFKTEGIDTAYLIDFIDSHRDNLVAMGLFHEKIDAAVDELLNILNKMPKNVSLTFIDHTEAGYTEAGYYFYCGIVLDSNYYPSSDTGLLIIEENEVVITKEPAAVENLVYTGEDQELVVAGTAEGGKLVYSLTEDGEYSETIPVGKDAGTYTVYYKVIGDGNHNDSEVQSVTVTIAKADSKITAAPKAVENLVYTGEDQELVVAGTAEGGKLVYSLTEDGEYSETIPVGKEPGEYTVYYKVIGDDNHNDSAVQSITVTIIDSHSGQYPVDMSAFKDHETIREGAMIYVDGIGYKLDENLTAYIPHSENDEALFVTTYVFNKESDNPHDVYPTNMYAWLLTFDGKVDDTWAEGEHYTAERIEEFDDIMSYIGCSIRVTGKKGIRMKTGIPTDTRNAMINSNVLGWRLMQTGTCVEWADKGDIYNNLTLATNPDLTGYAYKRGEQDPVFARANSRDQFTNVLVGFNNDQCRDDLVMRPYMILENVQTGQQAVLYGAPVQRSIGYIAYQNRLVYNPGHPAYDFIWGIIHHVYGDKYDADFKG